VTRQVDKTASDSVGGTIQVGTRSDAAYARARMVFPGGVTRATVERDPVPRYVSRAEGPYLYDVDNRRFLDLNCNFTTLIHGHAFPPVMDAIDRQLRNGTCFANPTDSEIALAELLCARVPRLDRIRFVNTGTEAVMFAVKAARAFTGRHAIAKLEGAYHGAYDWVEVSQASTPANWGGEDEPASTSYYRGMPASVLAEVVVVPSNNPNAARRLLSARAADLAAIIIDPMPSRAGLVPLETEFIRAIQETAKAHGILIISDEVLNFRQSFQGASARLGIEPDLFALGKIIGGGLPIGAVGGTQGVMSVFDGTAGRPLLPQGGTFSANPLSMVAGHAAMSALTADGFNRLERMGNELRNSLVASVKARAAPFSVTGAASLFHIHPKSIAPRNFRGAYCNPAEVEVMTQLSRYFAEASIILPRAAAACLSTAVLDSHVCEIAAVFDQFLATRADLFGSLV
jgi:glutamate-1-semialdehyde 2,1-aminomutase